MIPELMGIRVTRVIPDLLAETKGTPETRAILEQLGTRALMVLELHTMAKSRCRVTLADKQSVLHMNR